MHNMNISLIDSFSYLDHLITYNHEFCNESRDVYSVGQIFAYWKQLYWLASECENCSPYWKPTSHFGWSHSKCTFWQTPQKERDAFNIYMSQRARVQGILLASMSCELQSQHEDMEPQDIIMHLRELYGQQARIERYKIASALFSCRMKDGQDVVGILCQAQWKLKFSMHKINQ